MTRLYLDHNATSPLKPIVREAMLAAMEQPTNASSVHAEGQWARRKLNEAREEVAALVAAKSEQVYFTSGATEANNWVLKNSGKRLLVSAIEHSSVLEAAPDATIIPVGSNGIIDLAALQSLLTETQVPTLVSLMLVNNETGIIQPVREAAALAHAQGAQIHVDAVQAAGRVKIDMDDLGADYLTLSAHKIGGPQGIGALVMAGIADVAPFLRGGTQENRRRAGTENIAGAIGFGVAARLARDCESENLRLANLRDQLETQLQNLSSPAKAEDPFLKRPDGSSACAEDDNRVGIKIIGKSSPRVGNTSLVAVPGWPAETQLIGLDIDGIAVGSGSACSSGKVEPSHVLTAMGYSADLSRSAIRVSLGWTSTDADIARFVLSWQKLYNRHRARLTLSPMGEGGRP